MEGSGAGEEAAIRGALAPRVALWAGTLLSKHSHGREGAARKLILSHSDLKAVGCSMWLELYADAQQFPITDETTLSPEERAASEEWYDDMIETRERMKETSAVVEAARGGVAGALGEGARADELVEMLHRREDALDYILARAIALDGTYRDYGCKYAESYWLEAGMPAFWLENERVPEAMADLEEITREEVQALELSVKFRALEADLSAEGASGALRCGDAALADRLLSHYRDLVIGSGAGGADAEDAARVDAARSALGPIVSACDAAGPDAPLVLTAADGGAEGPTAALAPGALDALRAALEGSARGAWAPDQCAARLAQLRGELIVPPNPPLSDEYIEAAKDDLIAAMNERSEARALWRDAEAARAGLDAATGGAADKVLGALAGHDEVLARLAVRIAATDPEVERFACTLFEPAADPAATGAQSIAVRDEVLQANGLLASLDLQLAASASPAASASASAGDGGEGSGEPGPARELPCGLLERIQGFLSSQNVQLQLQSLDAALEQCSAGARSDPEEDGAGADELELDDEGVDLVFVADLATVYGYADANAETFAAV